MMGVDDIRLDRMTVNVNYDFASGGAMINFGADLDKLAALSGSVNLDYISYRMDLDTEEVMPSRLCEPRCSLRWKIADFMKQARAWPLPACLIRPLWSN